MKFWIKIVVALSIVIVIGFAVWAFFFKEKDEVVAYNTTAELVDYKASLGLKERLVDLDRNNYWGTNKNNTITDVSIAGKEILQIRKIVLGTNIIESTDDQGVLLYSYDTYFVLDRYVDEIIEYFMPYMKDTSSVSGNSAKQLKNAINDYISSLKEFSTALDVLITAQKEIDGSDPIALEVLKGHYNAFRLKYRSNLNLASDVILSITNYVNVSVYRGNFKFDTVSALYDCFARRLNKSTSSELIMEIEYAHGLHFIVDKISKSKNDINIYSNDYTKYAFLVSYNDLFTNYPNVLNYVFASTNLEVTQMADNIGLSQVPENAQSKVVTMLNVIGF